MYTFSGWGLIAFALAGATIGAMLVIGTNVAIRIYKRSRKRTESVEISVDGTACMQIWQTIYQQSAEALRDQAKFLANANFSGLAGCIALLAWKEKTDFN